MFMIRFVTLSSKDAGALLDFTYTNEDIESLRHQMQHHRHVSSPLSEGEAGMLPFCSHHYYAS